MEKMMDLMPRNICPLGIIIIFPPLREADITEKQNALMAAYYGSTGCTRKIKRLKSLLEFFSPLGHIMAKFRPRPYELRKGIGSEFISPTKGRSHIPCIFTDFIL